MYTNSRVVRTDRDYQAALLHNLFSSCIRNRKYVPGRENFDEKKETAREQAEFDSIDTYIEQA